MSRNQSPVQIVLSDSFYEIVAQRRADRNAKLAADGLPLPTTSPHSSANPKPKPKPKQSSAPPKPPKRSSPA